MIFKVLKPDYIYPTLLLLVFGLSQSCWSENLWVNTLQKYGSYSFSEQKYQNAQPIIEQQKQWYFNRLSHLKKVSRRSEPYAYYIIQRCIERGLPVELALMPFIESSYDPFAYSQAGASGLWQFMPATAKSLGLGKSWWFDSRRDLILSTDAALDYLEKLYKRYDDWLLAVAAYNSGPARVSRAIRKNKKNNLPTDFWSLNLPKETRNYVPRLLALNEVIRSVDISVHPIANTAYFAQVEIPDQIDLAQAAEMAKVDIRQIYRLNPGLNQWATPPTGSYNLLLPVQSELQFKQAYASLEKSDLIKWQRYKVKSGDTVSNIAKRKGSRTDLIKMANDLDQSLKIKTGQYLFVPIAKKSSEHYVLSHKQRLMHGISKKSGRERIVYKVKQGDSLWQIARQYKTSVTQLVKWNQKSAKAVIKPGEKLVIWKKADGLNRARVSRTVYYTVKRGDNLSKIAEKYNVKVRDIKNWNTVAQQKYLQPGNKLEIKVPVLGNIR